MRPSEGRLLSTAGLSANLGSWSAECAERRIMRIVAYRAAKLGRSTSTRPLSEASDGPYSKTAPPTTDLVVDSYQMLALRAISNEQSSYLSMGVVGAFKQQWATPPPCMCNTVQAGDLFHP